MASSVYHAARVKLLYSSGILDADHFLERLCVDFTAFSNMAHMRYAGRQGPRVAPARKTRLVPKNDSRGRWLVRSLKYLCLLVIVALNCGLLFFATVLAVGGEGGTHAVKLVLTVGALWVLLFSIAAFALCVRGRATDAMLLASATLPAAWFCLQAALVVAEVFGIHVG